MVWEGPLMWAGLVLREKSGGVLCARGGSCGVGGACCKGEACDVCVWEGPVLWEGPLRGLGNWCFCVQSPVSLHGTNQLTAPYDPDNIVKCVSH